MAILNAGGNASQGGVAISAQDGYYTLTDSADITLTNHTTYWSIDWS